MAQGYQAIGVPAHQDYQSIHQLPAQGAFDVNPPKDLIQFAGPSAPPVMSPVSGYEDTTAGYGEGKYFPPPPDLVPNRGDEPPPALRNWNIPAISEDEAKEAFLQYAASKCCYSQHPAKEMLFQDLQSFNTYRYRLETFTESRSTVWKTEPYNGEVVDSYLCGAAPLPWDIIVEIPDIFRDHIKNIKVPHTSSVKGCPTCGCSGRLPCRKCRGLTRQECWVCNGRGLRLNDERCTTCLGTGTSMCDSCSGLGTTACRDCGGKGQLLSFIELQVEWKNKVFEYLVDQRTGFPTERFKEVSGKKLFVDEEYMVYPVISFPHSDINRASRNAVEQHRTQLGSTSRILRQRQTIELIFLTKVEYEWHRKSYSYFVYGNEHKVYAEDYPRKCCCTIL